MQSLEYKVFAELERATKENPMDRYIVAPKLGVSEDRVRKALEKLRRMGIPICASSSNTEIRGYWIAETALEFWRFNAEYTHRAEEIKKTSHAMQFGLSGWIFERDKKIEETENALLR